MFLISFLYAGCWTAYMNTGFSVPPFWSVHPYSNFYVPLGMLDNIHATGGKNYCS